MMRKDIYRQRISCFWLSFTFLLQLVEGAIDSLTLFAVVVLYSTNKYQLFHSYISMSF